jgi:hypothetical protein
MRIAVPQTAKLYPIDRNPATIAMSNTRHIYGPAPLDVAWAYTVPAGRAFMMTIISLLQVVTAQYDINNLAGVFIAIEGRTYFSNIVLVDAYGNNNHVAFPVNVLLSPGMLVQGLWEIGGGASVNQRVSMIGVEYDR